MRIGVPREVKNHEYRVALTPAGVHQLVTAGHNVVIETGAGDGSLITDEDFMAAGAQILGSADPRSGTSTSWPAPTISCWTSRPATPRACGRSWSTNCPITPRSR